MIEPSTVLATPADTIWQRGEFRSYLQAVAFSGVAFAMQQLLLTWLLIGVLELPADRVGLLQAAIGLPGVLLLLLGGASADRSDARALLVRVYAAAISMPIALVVAVQAGLLGVPSVMLWGLGMNVALSFSSPAQQAILNRVAVGAVQQGVTAATLIGMAVQVLGLALAGQMDRLGLSRVLLAQAASIGIAALLVRRIAPQPGAGSGPEPAWRGVLLGLRATYRNRIVFDALTVNFVSSIFNAGAFLTVFPFIIKRVYGGDAALLSLMMGLFFASALVSNLILLRVMPFVHPGRWFVVMQLSRIVVLALLWIEPPWWLLVVATTGWGLNMGVTSTLARTIVQESAEPAFRGRVMSVFSLGLLGSPLIGAAVLGWLIETFGVLDALVPGMITSLLLFVYSIVWTGMWPYRSPQLS